MSNRTALVELLHQLRQHAYHFTPVTPATHAIVLARSLGRKANLRDILGWNRPFAAADLDPDILALLERAGVIDRVDGRLRSRVRVASLEGDLFLHSAYPTLDPDSVFFGPDTSRFVRWARHEVDNLRPSPQVIVDMGCGSGAGGILLSKRLGRPRTVLVDVNEEALHLARANSAAAGLDVDTLQSDRIPDFDLLVANAPYLVDPEKRAYRDGGALFGGAVTLDWVRQAMGKLRPGQTVLIYTGAAYIDGSAPLLRAIDENCRSCGARLRIDEIDPDVFGEELVEAPYTDVERIAAVGIRIEAGSGA